MPWKAAGAATCPANTICLRWPPLTPKQTGACMNTYSRKNKRPSLNLEPCTAMDPELYLYCHFGYRLKLYAPALAPAPTTTTSATNTTTTRQRLLLLLTLQVLLLLLLLLQQQQHPHYQRACKANPRLAESVREREG